MALPRWRGARADLLREVAASHGCGRAGSAELSKRLGEHVSDNAMAGGLARIKQRGHEAGGKIPFPVPRETKQAESFRGPAAPFVRTDSKVHRGNDLWISDLQLPFTDPRALPFCQQVRRDYNVPITNIGCVGDEIDLYWASRYPKSPDARYTPNQETDAARLALETWWHAFPHMMLCDSNHRGRAVKALARGGIPERFLADLRTVLGTPDGWRWKPFWVIDGGRHTYRAEHGHKKPTGASALRLKPLWRQMSVLWGHEHKEPGTLHLNLDSGAHVWAMRVGSLMDREINEANEYASEDAGMPALSVGVVTDGGKTPHVVHM